MAHVDLVYCAVVSVQPLLRLPAFLDGKPKP